jgi:NAD(P)-dependent dehydrogenase (short-subunit alcohol dehydrogenase family)
VVGDVSDDKDSKGAVQQALETFGGLDMAVNCAGLLHPVCPLDEVPEAVFDRLMAVNVKGIFLGMRHQIPALKQRLGGAIVNFSSVAGLRAAPGLGAYAATKHAVMGLTRSAALENAGYGIRVNAVCPGLIDTPMTAAAGEKKRQKMIDRLPMQRLGTPEEMAEAVCWLLSPAASYCTGIGLTVDGGFIA